MTTGWYRRVYDRARQYGFTEAEARTMAENAEHEMKAIAVGLCPDCMAPLSSTEIESPNNKKAKWMRYTCTAVACEWSLDRGEDEEEPN